MIYGSTIIWTGEEERISRDDKSSYQDGDLE
jgi:hypothetical protein